jgi:chromate transport protein ChrA
MQIVLRSETNPTVGCCPNYHTMCCAEFLETLDLVCWVTAILCVLTLCYVEKGGRLHWGHPMINGLSSVISGWLLISVADILKTRTTNRLQNCVTFHCASVTIGFAAGVTSLLTFIVITTVRYLAIIFNNKLYIPFRSPCTAVEKC